MPISKSQQRTPQSDEKFILQAYKEKLEGLVNDAEKLKSHAPNRYSKLLTGNSKETSDSKVSDHDSIYLDQIAQLKADNKALKDSIKSLHNQNIVDSTNNGDHENQEAITDDDLNYPVLPDSDIPVLQNSVIERKRGGSWHKLVLQEPSDSEEADNPSFGHAGIAKTNILPKSHKLVENAGNEGDIADPVFKAVGSGGENAEIEVKDKEKTATTDVVTLTVAAIALLCAVVFIVFTAVQ